MNTLSDSVGFLISGLLVVGLLVVAIILAISRLKKRMALNQQQDVNRLKRTIAFTYEEEEKNRKKIVKILHEDVGHRLQALNLTIAGTKDVGIRHQVQTMVNELSETIRRVSWNLMPSSLDRFGLTAALDELCHRKEEEFSIPIKYEISGEKLVLDKNQELIIYRVIQEALENALLHSEATIISLKVRQFENQVTIRVIDNGKGFNFRHQSMPTIEYGTGLTNMESRVSMLKGNILFEKNNNGGTIVMIQIPVHGSI